MNKFAVYGVNGEYYYGPILLELFDNESQARNYSTGEDFHYIFLIDLSTGNVIDIKY